MKKQSPCTHTVEQICDILEVKLGTEAGSEACKKIQEQLKDCPTCCVEVDTLSKTIKVFQQIPEREVPRDVSYRLMTTLKLDTPDFTDPKG